jgi:subtilase family serine protease
MAAGVVLARFSAFPALMPEERNPMRSRFTRTGTVAVAAAGACALALPMTGTALAGRVAGPAPHHAAGRAVLAGSAPQWTRTARVVGAPEAGQHIAFNVALRLRHQAAAERLAQQVSRPASPRYAHYLTARQFNRAYGPTRRQAAAVRAFLEARGIRVTGTAAGRRWVSASATPAQIQRVFQTRLRIYSVHGHRLRGAARDLSVPAAIRPLILGVTGVSQLIMHPASQRPVPASTAGAQTGPHRSGPPPAAHCSVYWNQHSQTAPQAYGRTRFPTPNCGYTPRQIRMAYGLQGASKSGITGKGVNVAIVDAYNSPTIVRDVNAYSRRTGEPVLAPGQYTDHSAPRKDWTDQQLCGGAVGWHVEQTLDVEAMHGVAPGVHIAFFGAANCDTAIDTELNRIVQTQAARIVSNSFGFAGEGGLGSEVALERSIFVQGALEGIGFYFSTGDWGDNTPLGDPVAEADYPATDPMATAVGGTSLALNRSRHYKFETDWGNLVDPVNFKVTPARYQVPLPGVFGGAGGGGASRLFIQPLYQNGVVPVGLATQHGGSTPMRVTPDVATVGDPETGYLICFDTPRSAAGGRCPDSATFPIGGTSLSCPVFAAIQALASQGRVNPIGFANPALYTMPEAAFHDVRPSNAPAHPLAMVTDSGKTLITMATNTSLTDAPGFDDTTGLGTPRGRTFLRESRRR